MSQETKKTVRAKRNSEFEQHSTESSLFPSWGHLFPRRQADGHRTHHHPADSARFGMAAGARLTPLLQTPLLRRGLLPSPWLPQDRATGTSSAQPSRRLAGDAHAGPEKPFRADSAPARGGHAAQLQLKALAAAFGTTAAPGGLDAPGGPP